MIGGDFRFPCKAAVSENRIEPERSPRPRNMELSSEKQK
jgi:hypothetical protein